MRSLIDNYMYKEYNYFQLAHFQESDDNCFVHVTFRCYGTKNILQDYGYFLVLHSIENKQHKKWRVACLVKISTHASLELMLLFIGVREGSNAKL